MLNLYDQLKKTKLKDFADHYQKAFDRAPAAQTHHHNFTGGLLLHTTEVLTIMQRLRNYLPYNNLTYKNPDFNQEEMIVAAYLHDFAKIVTYVEEAKNAWRWADIELPDEVWTLNELARAAIALTDNELNALLYAEGGWSNFKDFVKNMKPLAVLLHMADMWSAKVLYFIHEIACPQCGAPMRKRAARDGSHFYGCTKYPVCTVTRNISDITDEYDEFQEKIREYKHRFLKK